MNCVKNDRECLAKVSLYEFESLKKEASDAGVSKEEDRKRRKFETSFSSITLSRKRRKISAISKEKSLGKIVSVNVSALIP